MKACLWDLSKGVDLCHSPGNDNICPSGVLPPERKQQGYWPRSHMKEGSHTNINFSSLAANFDICPPRLHLRDDLDTEGLGR